MIGYVRIMMAIIILVSVECREEQAKTVLRGGEGGRGAGAMG